MGHNDLLISVEPQAFDRKNVLIFMQFQDSKITADLQQLSLMHNMPLLDGREV